MNTHSNLLHWQENETNFTAIWQSANQAPTPKKLIVADDRMTADQAYRYACEGIGLIWRGDFQNAKQLTQALARRLDKLKKSKGKKATPQNLEEDMAALFHLHRRDQVHRSRILGMVLIPVQADLRVPLRRAPDIQEALEQALPQYASHGNSGSSSSIAFLISLKELLGIIGAHQWRKNGVDVAALNAKIHPYYGVYSPVRGEYLDLVAKAPLPSTGVAFDIGTGTGVIAAILARRGISKIIATDLSENALNCAAENLKSLKLDHCVDLQKQDLFPPSRADLIVCNPPWLPAKPSSAIEYAIYDPSSQMLKSFLHGLKDHLTERGEAWLIMSDLAEHLGLRQHNELWQWIEDAGLFVVGKLDIRPRHGKSQDQEDPLYTARSKEITSLWRLRLHSQLAS